MSKNLEDKNNVLLVFDVDGTLLDTSEGLISSIRHTIKKFGKVAPSSEILYSFIGPPIQKSFALTYKLTQKEADDMAGAFRQQYQKEDLLKAYPYNGVLDLLIRLRKIGYRLAIATYKRQDYAFRLLDYFGFTKFTTNIHGADFEGKLSKADIIKNCISDVGISKVKKIIMIGDTNNDAIGADDLGIAFIGVTYGFGFTNKSDVVCKNLIGVVNKPMDIISVLEGY